MTNTVCTLYELANGEDSVKQGLFNIRFRFSLFYNLRKKLLYYLFLLFNRYVQSLISTLLDAELEFPVYLIE